MARKTLFTLTLISFLSFSCSTTIVFAQQKSITLKPLGSILNAKFKQGYAYVSLTANNDYLVWYEGYTHTLFIYNLAKKGVKKIKLKRGRGPHEFLTIYGIGISNNDIIYLVDINGIKIIRLKPSGEYLKDKIPNAGHRPQLVSIRNGYTVFSDPNNPKAMFYLWSHQKVIPFGNEQHSKEKTHNSYKLKGWLTIQGNNLVQVREYLPRFYVYNLKTQRLAKMIKFDDSKVDWGEPSKTTIQGATVVYPPRTADIINIDISRAPGSPYCIFLLAKGSSDHRTYGKNKLFMYNYKEEKFVKTFKLPFKVREITVNDHTLFAYSKEKNKIYRWKIIHTK